MEGSSPREVDRAMPGELFGGLPVERVLQPLPGLSRRLVLAEQPAESTRHVEHPVQVGRKRRRTQDQEPGTGRGAAGVRFQPIDGGEVAARLVGLSFGRPSGLVPDMAGPRVYEMKELVRSYLQASDRYRLIMPVRMLGRAARAVRAGANLAPEQAVGLRSWEDFLGQWARSAEFDGTR